MKRQKLEDRFGEAETSVNEQMTETIADALSSNDKVIEIRPAKRSKRMGMKGLLLLGAGVAGLTYWARNSRTSDDLIGSAKEKTVHRAEQVSEQAAETIKRGSETASERIETESERAGEAVEEAGEEAAEQTEEIGEEAAEQTEEFGEKTANETGGDASGFSGS